MNSSNNTKPRQNHFNFTDMVATTELETRDKVAHAVHCAMLQVCGGGDRHDQLLLLAKTSVSFPNGSNTNNVDGKPHDIEVKSALSFYHQCRKRKRQENGITVISDLGLERNIDSPSDLAHLICHSLEEFCREQELSHDVRASASGIICIVTPARAAILRAYGRLPCSQCIKWCKGGEANHVRRRC